MSGGRWFRDTTPTHLWTEGGLVGCQLLTSGLNQKSNLGPCSAGASLGRLNQEWHCGNYTKTGKKGDLPFWFTLWFPCLMIAIHLQILTVRGQLNTLAVWECRQVSVALAAPECFYLSCLNSHHQRARRLGFLPLFSESQVYNFCGFASQPVSLTMWLQYLWWVLPLP